MSSDDPLDSRGDHPNMFTGKDPGDTYYTQAAFWKALPMYSEKDKLGAVMNSLRENQVTIITSGTGSGKTVIVPKLCVKLAKMYGSKLKTAITNPKTTTTVSNAKFAALQNEVVVGNQIGYMTRNDKATSGITVLEYLTDGYLKSMNMSDRLFSRYAFLILDEIHERSIQSDYLLLSIRNALRERKDLRLVLMSATLDPKTFSDYFAGEGLSVAHVDVAGVPNKPIESLYMKSTPKDYLKAGVEIIDKIVAEKKGASILCFVSTMKECADGCRMLTSTKNCMRLSSKVSEEEKNLAIAESEDGSTKVVFATNLAESSITIKGLDVVVDSGMGLKVRYDPKRNMTINRKEFISKAEATQRKGRVGRTKPGTVYHLYSKEDYDKKFPDQPTPPMQDNDPVDDLFSLAASDEHRGNWSSALAHAKRLLSPPTPEQLKITQLKLEFFRCVGPTPTGGDGETPPSDKSPQKPLSNVYRLGPVGYTLHDIGRVFRTSFHNSLLILAGMLYGSVYQVLKVVAIMEETNDDLNALWKTNEKGEPVSIMSDTRVADVRSDHITLVNIFDSLGFMDTDFRIVPKIQERYMTMANSAANFRINFGGREAILENFPWCIGNRELTDPKEQFAVAVMIARLFNACKLGKGGKAKSLYIPNLTVAVDLKGAEEGDVVVCENFSSVAGKNTATVATAFLANVNLKCP